MEKIVEFQKVTFQYEEDPDPMFEELSFSVGQGEFVAVAGASGCGKSTLFRLIHQLEAPEEGHILVGGKEVKGQKGYSGFMPQRDLLMPWRTLERNLALPLELKKVPKGEQKRRIQEMLERVGLGGGGGQRRKVPAGALRRNAAARLFCQDASVRIGSSPFGRAFQCSGLSDPRFPAGVVGGTVGKFGENGAVCDPRCGRSPVFGHEDFGFKGASGAVAGKYSGSASLPQKPEDAGSGGDTRIERAFDRGIAGGETG